MKSMRWSVASLAVFGGLILLAVALFTLLVMFDLMDRSYFLFYWVISGCVILLTGLWMLHTVWIYADAERRGMNGAGWALLAFMLLFPLGTIVYFVFRKPSLDAPSTLEPPSDNPL